MTDKKNIEIDNTSEVLQVPAKAEEPFHIILPSLGEAGFKWKPREPFSPIEFKGSVNIPGQNFGGSGKEKLTFICSEPGTHELWIDLHRSFESEPQDFAHFQVVVK